MDPSVDVDELFRCLGTWGKYQKTKMALLLFSRMTGAFQLFSVVFSGYRPPFKCREPTSNDFVPEHRMLSKNASLYYTLDKCQINVYNNDTNGSLVLQSSCPNGYSYSVPHDRTFVTEWDLVCAGAERAELSQTLMILGQMIGASVFTSVADRFGRKPVFVSCHFAIFVIGIGASFAPDVMTFSVLRLCIGCLQQGMVLSNAVMMIEILPSESRFIPEVLAMLVWSSSLAIIAPIAYIFRNIQWRYFYFALSMYSSYSLFGYWLYDESIRWLLANGKLKEAERIVRKAAKMNKLNYESVIETAKKKTDEQRSLMETEVTVTISNSKKDIFTVVNNVTTTDQTSSTVPEVVRYSFITILKQKRVFLISIIMWYTWIVNSLTYFGLSLSSSTLSGNRFLNFFLLSVVEIPSVPLLYFLLNRIGRKNMCILMHSVAGLALAGAAATIALSDENGSLGTLQLVFFLVGKLGISTSFSTIFLYTPELYPTNLRNVGMGLSSATGRIGGMLSPFAAPLAERIRWLPGAIFSVMCLLVTVLMTFLPETRGHELPTTIEELKAWYKEHSRPLKSKKGNTNGDKSKR